VRTIAIVNQKGGCGKTTTAINLAGTLAALGHRTLLVDLDPQSHCAVGLGIPEEKIDLHIGDALLGRKIDPARLLWRVGRDLDLAPSTMRLAALEASRGGLAEAEDRDQRLIAALDDIGGDHTWRIIDCPPSIGLLTFNALRAADETIIPVETSIFAMRGAERQVKTIKSLARRLGGQTPYRILPTMHDPGNKLAVSLLAELEERFGDRLIPQVIRLDAKLKEAATFGQAAIDYDPASGGARDYKAVAEFLLKTPPGKGSGVGLGSIAGGGLRSGAAVEAKPGFSAEEPTRDAAPIAPISRAAELASRAEQVLARQAAMQAAAARQALLETEKQETAEREAAAYFETAQAERVEAVAPAVSAQRRTPLVLVEEEREAAASEAAQARVARLFGATETSQGVLFVQPGGPDMKLAVAGDFNGWNPERTPLKYNASYGVHEACVKTPPGRIEYRVVVDGRWTPDPYNRHSSRNPFGEENSVLVVARGRDESILEGAD